MASYTKYGLDKLNTAEHRQIALKAAREGIALLENRDHFLPISLSHHTYAIVINR